MNTLSNVRTRRGEYNPPTPVLPPASSPWETKFAYRVSSNIVKKDGYNWYVFRVTYNRVNKAYKIIVKEKVQVYLPLHYVQKYIDGKKRGGLKPLLPNIIFIYCTEEQAEFYIKSHPQLAQILKYYRDKTKERLQDGKHPPLVIRFDDMRNFINVTSIDNEHVKVVESERCHYKGGETIRVIAGDFKGVKGRVARVAGQQRVIVKIDGLCLIATAYIPTAFIEPDYNSEEDCQCF